MASCKILEIRCGGQHLGHAMRYIAEAQKTTVQDSRDEPQPIEDAVGSAVNYVVNKDKTVSRADLRYVSGINVADPEHAPEEFRATWRYYGKKMTGRFGYHLIQSFSPDDEITPEIAHQIGREMIVRLFPGHQAVIGTHLDRRHIHNHAIINAVNGDTGRKLHFKKSFVEREIWQTSDELCRQYGLSVIERSQTERTANRRGRLPGTAQRDLEYCLSQANNLAAAVLMLQDFGYEVNTSGTYIKIRPPGAQRFIRIDDRQDAPSEIRRIKGRLRAMDKTKRFSRAQPLNAFQAGMLQYVVILSRQRTDRRAYIAAREYQSLQQRTEGLAYIARNNIQSQAELRQKQQDLDARQAEIRRKRYQLIGTKERMSRLYEAERVLSAPHLHTADDVQNARSVMARTDQSPEKIRASRLRLEQDLLAYRQEMEELRKEASIVQGILDAQPNISAVLSRDRQERQIRQKARREEPDLNSEDGIEEFAARQRQTKAAGLKQPHKRSAIFER